jgi:hypothetical protein
MIREHNRENNRGHHVPQQHGVFREGVHMDELFPS